VGSSGCGQAWERAAIIYVSFTLGRERPRQSDEIPRQTYRQRHRAEPLRHAVGVDQPAECHDGVGGWDAGGDEACVEGEGFWLKRKDLG